MSFITQFFSTSIKRNSVNGFIALMMTLLFMILTSCSGYYGGTDNGGYIMHSGCGFSKADVSGRHPFIK